MNPTEWFTNLLPLVQGCTIEGVDCHTAPEEFGNGNAVEVESGILLYAMTRRYRPTYCMETGTHRGYGSSWIGSALRDNAASYPNLPVGHLFTVDSDVRPNQLEMRHDLWESVGVRSFITSIVDDSRKPAPYLPRILREKGIDFLYLDADHSAENLMLEWEGFFPYLNRQKILIAFHDSRLDPREAIGITNIMELREVKRKYRHIKHFPLRNMRGIDFLLLTNEEL